MKKKRWLVLLVLPFVFGCANNDGANPYQLVIDSTVTSKLLQYQAKTASRNDSILTALERHRADSLLVSVHAAPLPVPTITASPNLPKNKFLDTAKH